MGVIEQLDDAQLRVWPFLTLNLSGGDGRGARGGELIVLTVFVLLTTEVEL